MGHYEIWYEDLATDYERTVSGLFEAIGHAGRPVTPPGLRNQGDARSEQLLARFLAEFGRRAQG